MSIEPRWKVREGLLLLRDLTPHDATLDDYVATVGYLFGGACVQA
ncbi:hypothetical protein N181_19405 [Sinorhizobium fredii USDA 205]|nr:hypothetical protein AB395_00002243 [Sinorhizobium fredii CCBAU 45436]AWM25742.1 hypothetical protein AOX55_00002491 [Sinorhizobium fredii CCBAU 25509]KSV87120.1 hypothetical protein N181_19405 [Sinorhizobium fredii USDA 205]